MTSDALPGSGLVSLASMWAARVISGEVAVGGWAADPVDAPVDDPAGAADRGVDVATSTTATAAATAPIPAPMPTLPSVPTVPRRLRARENPSSRTGAAPGTGTISGPRAGPDSAIAARSVARARSYAAGRRGAASFS